MHVHNTVKLPHLEVSHDMLAWISRRQKTLNRLVCQAMKPVPVASFLSIHCSGYFKLCFAQLKLLISERNTCTEPFLPKIIYIIVCFFYLKRLFHDKSRTASLWPSSEYFDFYMPCTWKETNETNATLFITCFNKIRVYMYLMTWSLLLRCVFVNKQKVIWTLSCCTTMQEGNPSLLIFKKICFNIGPLTFLDFFRFLLPSETTGSSVSTKSKSQISMCGSIVPTATKLPVYKKW